MSGVNTRYSAFVEAGGGIERANWEYVHFISKMKILYAGCIYAPIFNHDEFTAFIQLNSNKFSFE